MIGHDWTGEEVFGSDFAYDKYFFLESDKQGLWHSVFLRGTQGRVRQELATFSQPCISHHLLHAHTQTIKVDGHTQSTKTHGHTQTTNDTQTTNAAPRNTSMTCDGRIQIDTDIVDGCKALLVVRLTHNLFPLAVQTHTRHASWSTSIAQAAQPPPILSTIIPLAKTESEPLHLSHALVSEEDCTWFAAAHTLIDPEEKLGTRNRKLPAGACSNMPSPVALTRAELFSGHHGYGSRGSFALRTRHSNVEQRIVAGILSRLESPNLHIRDAAVQAVETFIGFGNADAVRGVLRRLECPQLDVRLFCISMTGCIFVCGLVHPYV